MKRFWLLLVAALTCAFAQHLVAQTVNPLTSPYWTFVDGAGNPCSGCKLYTYLAGTSSPTPTYTDSTGGVQNANPIVLGVDGGPTNPITGGPGGIWVGFAKLKLILKDTNGVTIWTEDNIPGSGSSTPCGPANSIQIANTSVTGFDCDSRITINKLIHSINVGGPLPASHATITNLSPVTTSWTLDITSPTSAALAIGGGTHAAGKYIDGGTGQWTTLPSPGPGTVTSVGITPTGAPLSVSGSPVTTSGNIGLTLAVTGSGAKAATASAAGTSGNCAQWDASGNLADAGNPCALGTSVLASSGYQTFGSGLIMQWTQGTLQSDSTVTQVVTFPIACTTQVFDIIPSSYESVFVDTQMPVFVVISSTLTNVTLAMQRQADHGYNAATPRIEVLCK